MTNIAEHPVIYCYDGSDHAKAALARASKLLGDRPSIVVTAWRSPWTAIAAVPYAMLPQESADEIHQVAAEAANAIASEGAALIPHATPYCVRAAPPAWRALLDYADEVNASLIVAGSRGLSAIESTVLGSVSHGLVNHSHRPVLVVPRQ